MRPLRTLIVAATVMIVLWAPPAQTDVEPVGPEIPVNTFLPGNQQAPAVSTDASGGFVVVWESGNNYNYGATQDGSLSGVFGRRFGPSGTPLGGEIAINATTLGPQLNASVATSPGGSFVTAFEGGGYGFDQDGSASGVFLRRVAASGTPLGTDVQVNTFTRGPQRRPRVAADAAGDFVVVWMSGQYFGATQDGDGTGVFAQRYAAGGVPLGGEFQVNTTIAGNQSSPAIAVHPDGSFVIVWKDGLFGQSGTIRGQRFDTLGVPVGPEFPASTPVSQAPDLPAVATTSSGFVVVWQSYQDVNGKEILGRRFDGAGTPVGGEFPVNTSTSGDQEAPAVAADGDGNFVVVWDTTDEAAPSTQDANGVFGQHFASSGESLGDEFQVNTTPAGPQFEPPSVSATPDGDFVVAWTSGYYSVDTSNGRDVFAQRLRTTAFTPPSPVAGTRFVLRQNTGNARRRRLTLRADDPAIGLGLGEGSRDDPTLSGGRLRVRSAQFDDTYSLPASGWQRVGPPGAGRGWAYRDPALLSGPIERVEVRPGHIRVSGKGAQLDVALAINPDPVTAVLQLGSTGERACASLGGTTAFRPQRYFRAQDAPAPGRCPLH
jgi:hypothetical protein